MTFTSLKIENFRGIQSLEIPDLKKINVFVGKNNCGKTSILEAINLTLDVISTPNKPIGIQQSRSNKVKVNEETLKNLFYRCKTENKIKISLNKLNGNRLLTICAMRKKDIEINNEDLASPEFFETNDLSSFTFDVLSSHLVINEKENYSSAIEITSTGVKLKSENIPNPIAVRYFQNNSINQSQKSDFDSAVLNREKQPIIDVLKQIDPSVITLESVGEIIHVDSGVDRLLPAYVYGDGFNKILSILLAGLSLKDGILIIDELENGLHYKALTTLWTCILTLVQNTNIQLFISTHSYEALSALSEVSKQSEEDLIRIFRIVRRENEHLCAKYTASEIDFAIESNIEVR